MEWNKVNNVNARTPIGGVWKHLLEDKPIKDLWLKGQAFKKVQEETAHFKGLRKKQLKSIPKNTSRFQQLLKNIKK